MRRSCRLPSRASLSWRPRSSRHRCGMSCGRSGSWRSPAPPSSPVPLVRVLGASFFLLGSGSSWMCCLRSAGRASLRVYSPSGPVRGKRRLLGRSGRMNAANGCILCLAPLFQVLGASFFHWAVVSSWMCCLCSVEWASLRVRSPSSGNDLPGTTTSCLVPLPLYRVASLLGYAVPTAGQVSF